MNRPSDEHPVDARLREAMEAPAAVSRSIVANVLAAGQQSRRMRPIWLVAAAAVVVFAIVAVRTRQSRQIAVPAPTRSVLTIESSGPLLIVRDDAGRRWIVGPAAPRADGSLVLVIPH